MLGFDRAFDSRLLGFRFPLLFLLSICLFLFILFFGLARSLLRCDRGSRSRRTGGSAAPATPDCVTRTVFALCRILAVFDSFLSFCFPSKAFDSPSNSCSVGGKGRRNWVCTELRECESE